MKKARLISPPPQCKTEPLGSIFPSIVRQPILEAVLHLQRKFTSQIEAVGKQGEDDQDSGGNFYLEDPRFPLAAMHNPGFRLLDGQGRPQQVQTQLKLSEGNMIVFPAWLRHGVYAYRGAGRRISIAMNIDARLA